MKKVLVIEDDPKHMECAKNLVATFPQFEFTFATNLYEATGKSIGLNPDFLRRFHGIITDLHFPFEPNDQPQQIGIAIALLGRLLGKPVAIVSDLEKHSKGVQWVRMLWLSLSAHWHFGAESTFPWLIPETIEDQKVDFLRPEYNAFRDIYNPMEDGSKPYRRVVEDMIEYWKL